jgi:hypothetical protein
MELTVAAGLDEEEEEEEGKIELRPLNGNLDSSVASLCHV